LYCGLVSLTRGKEFKFWEIIFIVSLKSECKANTQLTCQGGRCLCPDSTLYAWNSATEYCGKTLRIILLKAKRESYKYKRYLDGLSGASCTSVNQCYQTSNFGCTYICTCNTGYFWQSATSTCGRKNIFEIKLFLSLYLSI
jgi:hypothetical protein